jgi:hypothetical protein
VAEPAANASNPAALPDEQLEQVSGSGSIWPPAHPPRNPMDGRVVVAPGQPYLGDLNGTITIEP